MRVVLQRVSRGRVTVAGAEVAAIGAGLVILVGVGPQDGEEQIEYLANKIV
ncbi:MAG: D-aminoacyl-tRNA deacylase, partial [Anaerolineales bacterium]|nr:D-aminoacyl-tRNA deacylase [Anaerolineales bacterium]